MNTIAKETPLYRRLAELETESLNIIDAYLKQVIADAKSPALKPLLIRLQEVRNEQWQLFEKMGPSLKISQPVAVAA